MAVTAAVSPRSLPRPSTGRFEVGVGAPYLTCLDAPRWNPGDSLRIEAEGNLLRGLVNGVEVISITDDVISEAGSVGMAFNTTLTPLDPSQYPVPIVESWCAGSLQEQSSCDVVQSVPASPFLLGRVALAVLFVWIYKESRR